MRLIVILFFLLGHVLPLSSQVVTNAGSIYGKVVDENSKLLSDVGVELSSDVIGSVLTKTGPNGSFRVAGLPPGSYSASFTRKGLAEIRQDAIKIAIGSNVELKIIMKPSPTEELSVVGETPLLDTQKTGHATAYSEDYLENIPGGRDPWFVLEMTPGIDSDRYNVAGSESGNQSIFFARGGNDMPIWNHDGINFSDFGGSPAYFNFDSFDEIEIITGGNDASIQTGAVVINLVTKRGGNRWQANGSYYYVTDKFQSDNTPQELIDNPIMNPITGQPAAGANRTDNIREYGLDIGGPLIKDKLFIWGAFRKNEIKQFSIQDLPDNTSITDYNFKTNLNFNAQNEMQFGYLWSTKDKIGREALPGQQAPESLWNQKGMLGITPLPGMWSLQHNWIPNDHTLLSLRYGLYSVSFGFVPPGGKNVPIIHLSAIPRWEQTFFYVSPVEHTNHDINGDLEYFKENLMGGDHEFKFGFVYSHNHARTFSSYGNGVLFEDYYQTTPGGPLTSGLVYAQHYIDSSYSSYQAGVYAGDTYRKDRLTLNLGIRFDRQTAKNNPSAIPAVPGYEQYVGAFDYPGGDPGIVFNDFSPRIGVTVDLKGNGKTILRGNFARYYDTFAPYILAFSDPTITYNGAYFNYVNLNGDREITPDELVDGPSYYGGLDSAEFDLNRFLAKRKYAEDLSNPWTNELIAGLEREIGKDFSIAATYTYRRYGNNFVGIPFGISSDDYLPGGTFHADTPLGTFDVPYYVIDVNHDGTGILTNVKDFQRSYHGVDLTVRKRMHQNFLLSSSLTLQQQKAHYNSHDARAIMPSISFPGRVFAFDPTSVPFLDDQTYAFTGRFGILPFSEWYLKISAYYQLPWEIAIGGFLRYQQGYPLVLSGDFKDPTFDDFYNSNRRIILLEPYGSRRLENKFTLDLRVEKAIDLGTYGRLTGIVDVFNVTNSNTVLRRNTNFRAEGTADFYQIQEIISPRAARFGLRYSF
jgi:hypothetical protein